MKDFVTHYRLRKEHKGKNTFPSLHVNVISLNEMFKCFTKNLIGEVRVLRNTAYILNFKST